MKKKVSNKGHKGDEPVSGMDFHAADFASAVLNNTSDAITAINLKGEIIFWNKGAATLSGYSSEEALGKHISMVYRKQDVPDLVERIKKALKGEFFVNKELILVDKEQKEHAVLLTLNGLRDESGKITKLVGFTKDITELKRAEKTLVESEQRFQQAFDNASLPMSILNLKTGKRLAINKAFINTFGYREKDLLEEKDFIKVNIAVDQSEFISAVKTVLKEGSLFEFPISMYKKSGEICYTLLNATRVYPENKDIYITSFLDVTDRKESEQAWIRAKENAERSENFLDSILNNIGDPVFVKDDQSRLILVNDSFCKLFDLDRENIIGNTLAEDVAAEEMDAFLKIDREVLESGEENIIEEELTVRGGATKTIYTRKTRYVDGNGKKHLIGVIRDITERKKSEEALMASEEKFRNLSESAQVAIAILGNYTGKEFVYVNTYWEYLTGYTKNEARELDVLDVVASDYKEVAHERARKRLAGEDVPMKYELKLMTKSGDIKWVDFTATVIKFENKNAILTTALDITDKKLAQDNLNETLSRLNLAVNTAKLGVWSLDVNTDDVHFNDEMFDIFGFDPDTFDGNLETVLERVHDDDLEQANDKLKEVYRGESVYDLFFRVIRPDSGIRFIDWSATPVMTNGKVEKIIGIVKDTTIEREKNLLIKSNELRYRSLFETARDGLFLVDDGKIIDVNQAMIDMFGYQDASEIIGKMVWDISPVKQSDGKTSESVVRSVIKNVFKGESIFLGFTHLKKDGTEFETEVSFGAFDIDRKKYMLGIVRDVTERKQSEKELADALLQLTELKQQIEAENIYLKEELKLDGSFNEIVGSGKPVRRMLKQVQQVAKTDTTVLILGETGTGKELIARAIHNASNRKDKPLVKVNCSALPSELIESEFFGHEAGAFTSAVARKIGRFELANGGTIFLDEIGDLPLGLQTRLLRVLQESEFERVGGEKTIKVNVRVITATNRNLQDEVLKGNFRQDLYYRLNVFPIKCPPLRERSEDIPLLVNHFIHNYNQKLNKNITSVNQKDLDRLKSNKWPGNIRELEHVIERAVIVSQGSKLQLGTWFMDNDLDRTITDEFTTLENVERDYIYRVLERVNWKIRGKRGAAEILGLKPTTLESRMKKWNISRKNQ